MRDFERKITKTKGNEWCAIEIRYKDGRLSICGEYGDIVKRSIAKKMALDYWESFFEDSPEERHRMNERFNKAFKTARGAAKFVVETDGEFHGLEVVQTFPSAVYLMSGCGQIREELNKWFPEFGEFYQYHLNDTHAGCEHQDKLGWGNGVDVAITHQSATEIQNKVLTAIAQAEVDRKVEKEYSRILGEIAARRNTAIDYWKRLRGNELLTVDMAESIERIAAHPSELTKPTFGFTTRAGDDVRKFFSDLKAYIAKEYPVKWDSQIFKDSLCAPCPECGYRYGTKWLKREIPEEVLNRLESLLGAVYEPSI